MMIPPVHAAVRAVVKLVNTPLARSRFRGTIAGTRTPFRLEIGGTHDRPGWVVTNVNAVARNFLDATSVWPIPDRSTSFIFCDNMIEHVTLNAARIMLAEARRCLVPGGVFRLVTPDIRSHAEMYLAGSASLSSGAARHYKAVGLVVEHPIDLVRIPIGAFGHHSGYVYDYETLRDELFHAGFTEVLRQELGCSDHPELRDLDTRHDQSSIQLAVEAS